MIGKFFQTPTKQESERVPPGQHLAKGFPVLTYGEELGFWERNGYHRRGEPWLEER